MDLRAALSESIQYVQSIGNVIPPELYLRALFVGAVKADGDLTSIKARYHDAITEALINYFEGKGSVTVPSNKIKQAAAQYLGESFNLGWADGGGGGIPDDDARDWYVARLDMEFGYIGVLLQEAKELRKEDDFDYFSWLTDRADGYTRTTREFYNEGKLRSSRDVMVTFVGDDGAESCPECQTLKNQRHRVSWFVRRNFVPPHGTGLSCHRGRYCRHFLQNDKGERVTV